MMSFKNVIRYDSITKILFMAVLLAVSCTASAGIGARPPHLSTEGQIIEVLAGDIVVFSYEVIGEDKNYNRVGQTVQETFKVAGVNCPGINEPFGKEAAELVKKYFMKRQLKFAVLVDDEKTGLPRISLYFIFNDKRFEIDYELEREGLGIPESNQISDVCKGIVKYAYENKKGIWSLEKEERERIFSNPPEITKAVLKKETPSQIEDKSVSKAQRRLIPNASQSLYSDEGICSVNAFAAFVMWWDDSDYLTFPRNIDRKNRDKKFEWVHGVVRSFFNTRKKGTGTDDVVKGIPEFCKQYFNVDVKDCKDVFPVTPEELTKAAQGYNVAILSLSIYEHGKFDGGHAVPVIEADKNGGISFNTWGYRFEGKLEPADERKFGKNCYLIKIVDDPSNPLRDTLKKNNTQFVIDNNGGKRTDRIIVAVMDEPDKAGTSRKPNIPSNNVRRMGQF